MVHTIEFSNGGSDIQILRVAAYEEQWVSTANILDQRYLSNFKDGIVWLDILK